MRNALTSDTMLANDPDDQFKGTLYLDLKVHHIIFNQKGKYNVKLSINGSRGDPRKVKLYLNSSKQSIFEYEYISAPCFHDGWITLVCWMTTSFDLKCQKVSGLKLGWS